MKESLLKRIQSQSGWNKSIKREHYDYIKSTFSKTDKNDYEGRTWYKVHCCEHDSKFGAFMICLETEQWRGVTIDEF